MKMYRVLIVDDERPIRNGLTNIIPWSEYGFTEIETAANGQEAFDILKNNSFDLLITDIRMPLMDGITLVKSLRERNNKIETIILSGYKEFEYARSALQYGVANFLLKPVDQDELIQSVEKIKGRLDSKRQETETRADSNAESTLLFDLVRGEINAEEFELYISDRIVCPVEEALFCSALINIESLQQLKTLSKADADRMKKQIREVVRKLIDESGCCMMYDEVQDIIGLIFNGDKEQITGSNIEYILSRIHSELVRELDVESYITYGGLVDNAEALNESWEQAKLAHERQLIAGDKKVVYYENVNIDTNRVWDMQWDSKALLEAILNNSSIDIRLEIKKLTDEIKEKRYSHEAIRVILYNMFLDISKLVKSNNGDINDFIAYSEISDKIERSADTMNQWLYDTIIAISEYVEELQDDISSGVIFNIQKYIHDNYSSDITVKSIAAEFYVNASYLGRLFKKTVGVSFNEYLNKYRISQIKQMMQKKKMRTNEIIELSGYSTPEYFYRQFKRYEGISFVEYKKKIANKVD